SVAMRSLSRKTRAGPGSVPAVTIGRNAASARERPPLTIARPMQPSPPPRDAEWPTRRSALVALLGLVAACGGGGSSTPAPLPGSVQQNSLGAQSNATTYPLSIYVPPGGAGNPATFPVVYLLDGESRFQALVDIVEARRAAVIVVGIGNEALR